MRYLNRLIVVLAAALVLTACAGKTRTYVDPQFHHADWNSIHQATPPIPVHVVVHFQENGAAKPEVDKGLGIDVENTLRRSHVFMPVAGDTATGTITITANNLADLAAARRKGRHAALSFGSSPETLADNYVFDIAYKGRDGRAFQHLYKHRLISTMGSTKAPEGMTPTTLADGFQQVVQDVMLNFIQDWQSSGGMAQGSSPPPVY